MLTQNTTLCLVNLSGKDITNTAITVEDDATNWDGPPSRPDRNFTGPLTAGDSRAVRAEIARYPNSVGCWFKISLTFADHSTLSFRANQVDAYTKQSGVYTDSLEKSPENAHLEVFRRTGESRYVYHNAYYIRPSAAPDNSTWMGKLLAARPNVTLNHLTMPGSHDAGMYREGVSEHFNTQSLSIADQLQAGARYFDLRVCAWGSELWTYHGIRIVRKYGGKLDDILDDVKNFLASGAKEVVFLKFRSDAAGDRQGTVDLVKSKLGDLLYKAEATPNFATMKLKDLAGNSGRVVAAFTPDYESMLAPADGIFPYIDYGNEDTGKYIGPSDHRNLGVYDAYSHQSEFSVMQEDQRAKWATHGGYGKDYLFLLSWTLTGSTDNILDLDLLSAAANPQMPHALHTIAAAVERSSKGLPNIVYIDQVDPYLCKAIIDANDPKPESAK